MKSKLAARALSCAVALASLLTTVSMGVAGARTAADSGSASGSATGSFSGSAGVLALLPASSPRAQAALALATTQTGKPYRWGGTGPDAWDCSGLVQWAFRGVGIAMPRTTWEQAEVGLEVPLPALATGDVVVLNRDASHVGIYAGAGQVLNAYGAGVPVGLTPLEDFDIYTIRRFY